MVMARGRTAAPTMQGCSIRQAGSGGWIARDRRCGLERYFPDRQSAVHFALFDCGARAGAALLTPPAAAEPQNV